MTIPESVLAGGPWTVVAGLQVTLVAALGLMAWLAACRSGPALRGAIVLAALAGLLIVPGLAAVAPVWLPLPELRIADCGLWIEQSWNPQSTIRNPQSLPPPRAVSSAAPVSSVAEPRAKLPAVLEDPLEEFDDIILPPEYAEPAATALPAPPEGAISPDRPGEPTGRPDWSLAGVLALVWLLGALACLTRSLARLVLLYRWVRQARPVRDEEWTACLQFLAEQYGLPRVELRESPVIASPLTVGLFHPVILLPTARHTWSAEQRTLILAHELAHVRRRDFLAGLVAELAICLCWFHPLVRWLAGRLRLEQEYAADAWVAAANDSRNYVRCLARLALELSQGRGSLAPAFWRRRPEILRRIDMLRRNPHGQPGRLGRATAWTVTVLAAVVCLVIAGIGPLRSVAEDPKLAEPAPQTKAPPTVDPQGDPLPQGALARLGTTRWRHGTNITFVTFGPDGKTLITAGQDNTVRLWDLATGKEIRRFARPQPAEIKPPAIRPPGSGAVPGAGAEEKARLEAEKAQAETVLRLRQLEVEKAQLEIVLRQKRLEAERAQVEAQLQVVIRQRALLEAAKPQQEADKARLEAEKAKLEADKARLEAQQAALQAQVRSLERAGGSSFSVALSPDGKILAVANANVIQLYEVETGKELRKIEGPPAGMVALLFSPDSRTLAARAGDGSVILWATDTSKETQQIKAPAAPARNGVVVAAPLRGGGDAPGMAFTPDGKALAIVTIEFKEQVASSSLKFWDVATGKETQQIKGPEGVSMSAIAFAPGGKVLAYSAANAVYLCEPDTGKELRQIKVPDGVASLVFSPDGKTLAIRSRGQQVRLWETETGKELHQLGDAAPAPARGGTIVLGGGFSGAPETRNVAFSPDGKRIATTASTTVRLWDVATGKEVSLSDGHQGPVVAVVVSPDGKTVVSWGADRMVRVWDAATGKPLGAFRGPPQPTAMALSPDGRTVALADAEGRIRLYEAATGKELNQIKALPAGALAFSPDGKVLAARGNDNIIRLYDAAQGGELRQITAQAVNNPAPGGLVVAVPGRYPTGSSRAGLAFSPDGKLLASPGPSPSTPGVRPPGGVPPTSARGAINLYDVTTGKAVRKIEPSQPVLSIAFSPDGRVLATENADQSISLWEVASGKERGLLGKKAAPAALPPNAGLPGTVVFAGGGGSYSAEPAGPVTLVFAPDGRTLVTRGPDRSVRVWDVITGKEIGDFKGHEGRIETIAFAADGKTIASGSSDTTVLLWDAATLLKDLPKPQLIELAAGAVEPLWNDLAGEDAGKAGQSILKLAGAPKQALPFLTERLKPAETIEGQKIERWIADLESEKFAVRQEAIANLAKAGEQVVPPLQKILTSQPTIETRKRVEELLDKLTGGNLTAEQLRLVRAIEALEQMGTSEARQLLRTLAGGAPGALPTLQAQDALNRSK